MADNIPTYSVRFNSAGEWEIKKDGYTKALGFYLAKVRAVASAKGMAKANGGQLYVHGKDGKVQNKFDYSGRFRSQLPEVSTDTPMPPVKPPKPDPNNGPLTEGSMRNTNKGLNRPENQANLKPIKPPPSQKFPKLDSNVDCRKIIAKRTKKPKAVATTDNLIGTPATAVTDTIKKLDVTNIPGYVVPTYPVEVESVMVTCGGTPGGSGELQYYRSRAAWLQEELDKYTKLNSAMHNSSDIEFNLIQMLDNEVKALKNRSLWQRIKDVFVYERS